VLLPFVERARAERGPSEAAKILSQCFTIFLVLYSLLAAVLMVMAPIIVPYLFPGVVDATTELSTLIRILLLQPLLLGLSSLCAVVTQSERRFVIYALSPLLYNIGIIVGVLYLYPRYGLSGLGYGVLLGAAAHLLIQVPLVRRSPLRFSPTSHINWRLMRAIVLAALPRAATLSIHQVILFILISMATTMAVGSVAVFQLAFNLQSVPLAVIGMSYSVAAFPMLAEYFARNDRDGFNAQVTTALRHIIFWSLPVIGLVIVLRAHIVRAILGTGSFDWTDTRLTAAVMAMCVISLVGQAMVLLLVRAFYATSHMRTPFYVSLGTLAVTLLSASGLLFLFTAYPEFRLFLERLWRLEGVAGTEVMVLAMAFSVGVLVEVIVMLVLFSRRYGLPLRSLARLGGEAVLAATVGALVAYLTLNFIVDGIKQSTVIGILLQGGVAGITGLGGVVVVYALLRSRELQELWRSLHSRFARSGVVAPPGDPAG
jgi:putative peptidoglycan lipid II flippase